MLNFLNKHNLYVLNVRQITSVKVVGICENIFKAWIGRTARYKHYSILAIYLSATILLDVPLLYAGFQQKAF